MDQKSDDQTPKRKARVSIIGTAGRQADVLKKLNLKLFQKMVAAVEKCIREDFQLDLKDDVCLVSGGAAWADHIAVQLFLEEKCDNLRLYLPCPWDTLQRKFVDNGDYGKHAWRTNPGRSANDYHRKFQQKTGILSLEEIQLAKNVKDRRSIVNDTFHGFHDRNKAVAKSEYMIALTFTDSVSGGGTAHTWSLCKSPHKIHINLNQLS